MRAISLRQDRAPRQFFLSAARAPNCGSLFPVQFADNNSQAPEAHLSQAGILLAMNRTFFRLVGAAATGLVTLAIHADERRFTYVYEPETLPAGAMEFENWVTLRAGRTSAVGQKNFNRWDLRQELEYGVTDRYTVAVYLNEKAESFEDPGTDEDVSEFEFEGFSLENRYNVLNPAEHAVGFTLYLEGRYSGEEAEIEQKLIFGQRHGNWKWALNLEHATEWEDNLEEVEGEFGASLGLARDLGNNWSIGLEARNETLVPEYEEFESSAVFVGPVVSYRQEKWWAALTVLPQVYGWNHEGSDDNSHLDLAEHEKLNIRFLVGINFNAGACEFPSSSHCHGGPAGCHGRCTPSALANQPAAILSEKEMAAARKPYVAKCAKCHKFYEPKSYARPSGKSGWSRWGANRNSSQNKTRC
jgi:hypothetical protein